MYIYLNGLNRRVNDDENIHGGNTLKCKSSCTLNKLISVTLNSFASCKIFLKHLYSLFDCLFICCSVCCFVVLFCVCRGGGGSD